MPITGKAQPDNRQQPKPYKKPRFAHTANTKYGMGDHYGTGIKAKLGRVVEGIGQNPVPKKKIGTPPRGLA